MAGKPVISLSAGLEDLEKVTVAFLVAVGVADSVRPTLIFRGPTKRSRDGMCQ